MSASGPPRFDVRLRSRRVQRELHTLKGGARLSDVDPIANLAEAWSDALDPLISGSNNQKTLLKLSDRALGSLKTMLNSLEQGSKPEPDADLIEDFRVAHEVAAEETAAPREESQQEAIDPEVLEIFLEEAGEIMDQLEQLLDEFGLTRLRDSSAMALSGGERRRCEIARALAANPSIVLLDEPFAGIDPLSIADIRDLVKDLKNRGIGVLITDHNVRETLEIVDRACIIYGGQVLFAGNPTELVANTEVRRLYLGENFQL